MRCIALDDEPVALAIIEEFCRRDGDMEISTYTDPVVGMKHVSDERPDLVFLDIEMNGVLGTELAKCLPEGTYLIFTTAYARFALDGFELNAIDFLHKPFLYSRFETAVNKVRELMRLRRISSDVQSGQRSLTVRSDYRNVNIPYSSIQYVEAMDNYVKIHVDGDSPVVSQTSMRDLLSVLPAEDFVRIHKSFIIPLRRVVKYSRREVVLAPGGTVLPVGRVYADVFFTGISNLK